MRYWWYTLPNYTFGYEDNQLILAGWNYLGQSKNRTMVRHPIDCINRLHGHLYLVEPIGKVTQLDRYTYQSERVKVVSEWSVDWEAVIERCFRSIGVEADVTLNDTILILQRTKRFGRYHIAHACLTLRAIGYCDWPLIDQVITYCKPKSRDFVREALRQ